MDKDFIKALKKFFGWTLLPTQFWLMDASFMDMVWLTT